MRTGESWQHRRKLECCYSAPFDVSGRWNSLSSYRRCERASEGDMELTDFIGQTGTFQNWVLVIAMYRGVMLAINNLGAPFMFPEVDHWCAKHPVYANHSDQEWKHLAIPSRYSSGYEPCYMYEVSFTGVIDKDSVVPCDAWEYDHTQFWPTGTEKASGSSLSLKKGLTADLTSGKKRSAVFGRIITWDTRARWRHSIA